MGNSMDLKTKTSAWVFLDNDNAKRNASRATSEKSQGTNIVFMIEILKFYFFEIPFQKLSNHEAKINKAEKGIL
jgi:hypothetical protein